MHDYPSVISMTMEGCPVVEIYILLVGESSVGASYFLTVAVG